MRTIQFTEAQLAELKTLVYAKIRDLQIDTLILADNIPMTAEYVREIAGLGEIYANLHGVLNGQLYDGQAAGSGERCPKMLQTGQNGGGGSRG